MSESAALSHQGRVRDHNEDTYAALPELGLWLVADGVGGHACGEVASAIVRDTIVQAVRDGADLVHAINLSHSAVLGEIDKSTDKAGMGSTVVALTLHESHYQLAWVGDSRAYSFDGALWQLSEDHSQVNLMLGRGEITQDEAVRHPRRNVLVQSLGVSHSMQPTPGVLEGDLEHDTQFLLCSDGLNDELSANDIERIMRAHDSAQGQADALVRAALDAGGNDNITVVVVGEPVSEPEEVVALDPLIDTGAESDQPAAQAEPAKSRWWWLAVPVVVLLGWLILR